MRHELERVTTERDRMLQENSDIGRDKSDTEAERMRLKAEVKELKFRETRMLNDYSELEEENITLQKQVSSLRSSQVEFEGAKHEMRRLAEEIDLLHSQVEELANLKKIAEKQMEEALEALQGEREAKYALKKDLDAHINRESIYNISNLAYSIRGGGGGGGTGALDGEGNMNGSDAEEDLPALKRLEADLSAAGGELKSPDGTRVDLFAEIHLNELKRLEKQLEVMEKEKVSLTANLRDAQQTLDRSQNDLQNFMARVALLAGHVDALHQLKRKVEANTMTTEERKQQESAEKLQVLVHTYANWFNASGQEIETLKVDLAELQKNLNCPDALLVLRNEIAQLKNRLLATEQQSWDLQADVETLSAVSLVAGKSLGEARTTLVTLSDDLAQLYHLVCTVNGETPNRVLLEHRSDDLSYDNDSITTIQAQFKSELLASKSRDDLQALTDAVEIKKYIDTIADQVNCLKTSVEHTLKGKGGGGGGGGMEKGDDNKENVKEEMAELQEQVIKLKSLLSTKREQIATLRTVLKSNKNTAEVALTNLKSKYENEKLVVSDTMSKLRNELRILKEDAATFSSRF